MPESPRFLVAAKRFEDARRVFKWIGIKNGIAPHIVEQKMKNFMFEGEEEFNELEKLFAKSKQKKKKGKQSKKNNKLNVP